MAKISNNAAKVFVTYGEMIEVLTKLGYHPEFDGKHNRYINEKFSSWVILAIRPNDDAIERMLFDTYSYRLYMQGVIKEENSLMLMIEKNRLKKSKKSGNAEQASA